MDRIYSLIDIGISTYLISILILIHSFSKLGTEITINRYFLDSNKIIKQADLLKISLFLSSVTSIIFSIILFIVLDILNIYTTNLMIYLGIIFVSLLWITELICDAVFIASLNTKYYFIRNITFQLIKIIFSYFLVNESYGIFIGWSLSILVNFPISILLMKNIVQLKFSISFKINDLKNILNFSIASYFSQILSRIYPLLLPFMVEIFLGTKFINDYYISWLIYSTIVLLITSTNNIYLTYLSKNKFNKRDFNYLLIFILIFSFLLIILFFFFGPLILSLAYTQNLNEKIQILNVFIISTPSIGIIIFYQHLLIYIKQLRKLIFANFIHLLIVFILLIILQINLVYLSLAWSIGTIIFSLIILPHIFIIYNKLSKNYS